MDVTKTKTFQCPYLDCKNSDKHKFSRRFFNKDAQFCEMIRCSMCFREFNGNQSQRSVQTKADLNTYENKRHTFSNYTDTHFVNPKCHPMLEYCTEEDIPTSKEVTTESCDNARPTQSDGTSSGRCKSCNQLMRPIPGDDSVQYCDACDVCSGVDDNISEGNILIIGELAASCKSCGNAMERVKGDCLIVYCTKCDYCVSLDDTICEFIRSQLS